MQKLRRIFSSDLTDTFKKSEHTSRSSLPIACINNSYEGVVAPRGESICPVPKLTRNSQS